MIGYIGVTYCGLKRGSSFRWRKCENPVSLERGVQFSRVRMGAGSVPPPASEPSPENDVKTSQESTEEVGGGLMVTVKRFLVKAGKALGFIQKDKEKSMLAKLRSYGLAAVLSYGLLDGLTYSIAFAIALKSKQMIGERGETRLKDWWFMHRT